MAAIPNETKELVLQEVEAYNKANKRKGGFAAIKKNHTCEIRDYVCSTTLL